METLLYSLRPPKVVKRLVNNDGDKDTDEMNSWLKFMKWPCSPLRANDLTTELYPIPSKAVAKSTFNNKIA